MNTAELIYQETRQLSEAEAHEVLDFVTRLKTKRIPSNPMQPGSAATPEQRKARLMECFAHFQLDLSGFKFDREDANARH